MFGYGTAYTLTHPHKVISMAFREVKWAWQRVYRGWDDKALWGLDYWLIDKMLKLLPKFIEKPGVPGFCFEDHEDNSEEAFNIAQEKWACIIRQMIDGFEAGKEIVDSEFKVDFDDSHERYHKGMEIFSENLFSLWY